MMNKQALIIFTKNPEAGKVKTRLAASIGNDAALAVYQQLLQHTVAATAQLPVHKFVFYADHMGHADLWHHQRYQKALQHGNDLGERMKNAFSVIFQKGYNEVVIIGTDCPELSSAIIINSFEQLQAVDVVIGPAYDGGYYLLGLKQVHSLLFDDMQWSTAAVFPETVDRCKSNNLSFNLMPVLHDVDEEKDLMYLHQTNV